MIGKIRTLVFTSTDGRTTNRETKILFEGLDPECSVVTDKNGSHAVVTDRRPLLLEGYKKLLNLLSKY